MALFLVRENENRKRGTRRLSEKKRQKRVLGKTGSPIPYTPLPSVILRLKYRPAPFDDLLLAVIFVYLPPLRDGSSLRK